MIKTEGAYKKAIQRLDEDIEIIKEQTAHYEALGLSNEQVDKALQPTIAFHEQLKEEIAYYERIRKGDFEPIMNFTNLGKSLIAYRIYLGISQKELAKRLEVTEAQISRDERNEYYGATLERIQSVMRALGMQAKTEIQKINTKMA